MRGERALAISVLLQMVPKALAQDNLDGWSDNGLICH